MDTWRAEEAVHAERRLRLTRGCLEVLAEFRNPVVIVTTSQVVTRDADLLEELARHRAAAVFISITSLDANLARRMEPRASTPERRLDAIRALHQRRVPVRVMVAPVIPALNDHDIPAIIEAAAETGTIIELNCSPWRLDMDWRHWPLAKSNDQTETDC